MKLKLKISNKNVGIASFILVFVVVFYHFQLTGVRTIAAIILFLFLPIYMVMTMLKIDADERIFFAFFSGIGVFSTVVFFAGRVIPSFKFAVATTFVVLMFSPLIYKRLRKQKIDKTEDAKSN